MARRGSIFQMRERFDEIGEFGLEFVVAVLSPTLGQFKDVR